MKLYNVINEISRTHNLYEIVREFREYYELRNVKNDGIRVAKKENVREAKK